MNGEADIASVAAAIGHPARGAMLLAMLGGRALPATDLARAAGVSRSTASAHLAQLTSAGLVVVERQGRHRYHRLAGEEVAEAIERLAAIAPPTPVRSLGESNRNTAQRAPATTPSRASSGSRSPTASAMPARSIGRRSPCSTRRRSRRSGSTSPV